MTKNYNNKNAFILILSVFCLANGMAQPFITTWKTDNPGSSNSSSITIPTSGSGYNYDVDWNNDGVFDEFSITGSVTHDFGTAGTYTIRIQGAFPRIKFNNVGDKSKIIAIEQWGNIVWSSMESAFTRTDNLVINATDAPNLSNVTDMSFMFSKSSFTGDLSNWDVSNVTNMRYMFNEASSFNSDLSNWNLSKVTEMDRMFFKATLFNSDLSNWNVSGVTNMRDLFSNASSFTGNLSNWNVSNVTNMRDMFTNASAFNGDVSNWNVVKVTDMVRMFSGASSFNDDISNWDVSSVLSMTDMFFNATSFNSDISSWDVSKVTSMLRMFNDATLFNQDISNWDVSKVTDLTDMFNGATSFDQNLGKWDISSVNNMIRMLSGANLSIGNYDETLIGWESQGIVNKNIGSVSGFKYCRGNTARVSLLNNLGWTISSDTYECPVSNELNNTCYTIPTVTISTALGNNDQELPIFDSNGNFVCSIDANGNDLGPTSVELYLSTVNRTAGTTPLIRRDVTIVPAFQPSSSITVKLYYSAVELAALLAADPSVTSVADLVFSKTNTSCSGSFDGAGVSFP